MTLDQKPIMLRYLSAEPVEIVAGQLPPGHDAWEISCIQTDDEDPDKFSWPDWESIHHIAGDIPNFWIHAMNPTALVVVMGPDISQEDVERFCVNLQTAMAALRPTDL